MPQQTRCRFDCFVKLRAGIVSHFPQRKRTWCYRGDAFTDREMIMIRNLVKLIIKKIESYAIVELYDNQYPHNDQRRLILKINDGVIEITRLQDYTAELINLPLPEWLKPISNEKNANQINQG